MLALVGINHLSSLFRKFEPYQYFHKFNRWYKLIRPERIPRRQADGSGRDGFIVFSNGGFCSDYKPNTYGKDLRKYDIIKRQRFNKDRADFEDY